MKSILIWFLFINSTFALELVIESPCDTGIQIFSHDLKTPSTVGEITVKLLEINNIPFIGTAFGINSILSTPTGIDAMIPISDNEMNAYGWCYSVNGISPEEYPNKVILENGDIVKWWFGFAKYLNGKWITQCTPSGKTPDDPFCN